MTDGYLVSGLEGKLQEKDRAILGATLVVLSGGCDALVRIRC